METNTSSNKWKNRLSAIFHDVLVIPAAWLVAYWLRFNLSDIPQPVLEQATKALLCLIPVQIMAYWFFGLYRGIWRFASLPDLMRIIKAVIVGCSLSALSLFFYSRMTWVPRSIWPLYAIVLTIFLGGSRLFYRWFTNQIYSPSEAQRVLIIGAGQAGESLVRDLLRNKALKYKPVAFVDDNTGRQGREIHGIRVIGKLIDIPKIIKRLHVNLCIIALPSASSAEMRNVVGLCEESDVPFRTLPGLKDLADGRVSINALREVSIEDLLGREPVSLDWQGISQTLEKKIVLVSGGAGSIGSELCRQIARLNPAQLIVFENSEYNLYSLELELRPKFPQLTFVFRLGDVNDRKAVQQVMSEFQPEIIFHAAAYKHVPLLQYQARVAIRNNVLGTRILAEEAVAHDVKKFVLISTDKAVNPTNIMGATKRAAEIFCQNFNTQAKTTRFITVRFGNVLDSAGSVVPLFRKQIAAGGPVTVTHPEITRFFMTIPEAAQLILQATTIGKGGEIFVLDMGEPIKIRYLAEQMIKLAGRSLGEDIQIKYTGLRPGEKLYEELFYESEQLVNTDYKKIFQAQYRSRDWDELTQILKDMIAACAVYDEENLTNLLKQMVPEYQLEEQKQQNESAQGQILESV